MDKVDKLTSSVETLMQTIIKEEHESKEKVHASPKHLTFTQTVIGEDDDRRYQPNRPYCEQADRSTTQYGSRSPVRNQSSNDSRQATIYSDRSTNPTGTFRTSRPPRSPMYSPQQQQNLMDTRSQTPPRYNSSYGD
jgi:hypothetical protein